MLSDEIVRLIELLMSSAAPTVADELRFDAPGPSSVAEIPSLSEDISAPKVRKGCVIGLDRPSELPSSTVPLAINELGPHWYGGPAGLAASIDAIGHIYTLRGGIVDVAHARDHADLARYLATRVVKSFSAGGVIDLGDDTDPFRFPTGRRLVTIGAHGSVATVGQAALLGSYISYLVAVWHEIATFRNWQDYSCFSPEDNYSNLLGAYLGYVACTTPALSYDQAMTAALTKVLIDDLRATDRATTSAIILFLRRRWYGYDDVLRMTNPPRPLQSILASMDGGLPRFAIYLYLLRRHFDTGVVNSGVLLPGPRSVAPWLVSDVNTTLPDRILAALGPLPRSDRLPIRVPDVDHGGQPLDDLFTFRIENAASEDMSLFDGLLVGGTLDSKHFGEVAERIRSRYLAESPSVDRPD